jgi:glycosyltransferase involved in cell wall biosynthesis
MATRAGSNRPLSERTPLVSIITPTFNRAHLLEFTIRSIARQTYANFEHIVVDGASTDDTLEILERHRGTYPLRWISEPDGGMYAAINKGLRQARGSILAYLNSDDLYFPWTLETVVEAFSRHSEADVIFGDALTIVDATGQQRISWGWPFDLDFVQRVGFLVQPTVFWRNAVVEMEGPFDESLRYVADCDFWMRVGANHQFMKIHEFLAVERDHGETLRSTGRDALLAELRDVRSRYVRLDGPEHRRATMKHGLRIRLLYRVYWLRLTLSAHLPSRLRGTAWRRMLATGSISIDVRRVATLLFPRRGASFGWSLLRPSRYWLEPREPVDGQRAAADAP